MIPSIEELTKRKKENREMIMNKLAKAIPKSKEEEKLIELHMKLMEGGTCL